MATPEKPNNVRQVRVTRTELPAPDLADPDRKIIQVQYQVGEMPARFLYIPKKEWTKEVEAERINADINRRMTTPGEIINI